jgi:hypothetical protein
MVALAGTYQDGLIKLDKEFSSKKPVRVIVTFLEDDVEQKTERRLTLEDFNFAKTRKLLKNYKGTPFSDEVIEERRSAL